MSWRGTLVSSSISSLSSSLPTLLVCWWWWWWWWSTSYLLSTRLHFFSNCRTPPSIRHTLHICLRSTPLVTRGAQLSLSNFIVLLVVASSLVNEFFFIRIVSLWILHCRHQSPEGNIQNISWHYRLIRKMNQNYCSSSSPPSSVSSPSSGTFASIFQCISISDANEAPVHS